MRATELWNAVKDQLDRDPLRLSSGERQRLCLARALAIKPDVLLMDEPTAHLDHRSITLFEETINEVKADCSILIVTHNLTQAARVSDFVMFIESGNLIEFDTTSRIFTSPKERRTNDYVTGRFG